MKIGVPKEIKNNENRVGLVPSGVRQLTHDGHQVYIQKGAGLGIGLSDQVYKDAGAEILNTIEDVYEASKMIIKVKEPQPLEVNLLRKDHLLYTYLHLAAEKELTEGLLKSQATAVAYETIQDIDGSLPLLLPMSEVAGRLSTQIGAALLQKEKGGKGVLLGGVPGTYQGRVTVLGCGVAGTNALKMAIGLGAHVTALDVSTRKLAELDDLYGNRVQTLYSNLENIEMAVANSDLVIGSVLIPGARAPKLVTRKFIQNMEDGSVVIDIAVDQGGCIETCRPTTHENPTFVEEGVIHYGVTNMPGVVARTSTYALTNTTLKYARKLANLGIEKAVEQYRPLLHGLNTYNGDLVYERVARDLEIPYTPYNPR